jgi:glycosyltransferase involved in cell wall biosynthesis
MILALRRVERTHGIRIASLHAPDVLLLGRSFRALLCGAGEALARFDRYVCSSVHAESMLRREFRHVGSADVRTVPTGVDRWWFAEPAEPELQEFQRSINYWAGDRIVLTVGDLAAREGHLCTLEALGSLPEADRLMVKYVCIGKTVDPDYLKRLVRTAEAVGVRTVLPGNLPHELIRAAYRLAEVLAVSGQGLPMNLQAMGTLLEAAAQGLPALVNRVEPVPEVVRDRNTGWVCKGASSEEIGRTFAEALAGTERTAMRAACVAHASRFSWERCANATYNLGRPWRLDETYIEKYVGVS